MKWTVYRGHSYYFQKPLVGGRPNIEPGDHGIQNAHNRWFILRGGPAWLGFHWNSIWLRARPHMTSQCTWGSMTTYVILEVCWDGLWTLSFGSHNGHSTWLVCEVALTYMLWEESSHPLHGSNMSEWTQLWRLDRKPNTWSIQVKRNARHAISWEIGSEITVNYWVIVERHPFSNGVVGGSIPAEKSSRSLTGENYTKYDI